MAKWKLIRQTYGDQEFTFTEGDKVTIGRGVNNALTLSSLVISRNHCVLNVEKNELFITDLKSSNGVFVGSKKIPPNKSYLINDGEIIGIGWTPNVPLGKVQDTEKFVFKVSKEQPIPTSLVKRITFQSENESDEIEENLANLDCINSEKVLSPTIPGKPQLKRKIEITNNYNSIKETDLKICDNNIISIALSDSDSDMVIKELKHTMKKPKLESIGEELHKTLNNKNEFNVQIKREDDILELEAFNVKQEYLAYDEPIQIDSESDSESEHWFLRLSQSSPGKPFTKIAKEKQDVNKEDSSYSQMDDDLCNGFLENEEEYLDDLISIPPEPENYDQITEIEKEQNTNTDIVTTNKNSLQSLKKSSVRTEGKDITDGFHPVNVTKEVENVHSLIKNSVLESETDSKKAQLIEPLVHLPRKFPLFSPESKSKTSHKSHKHSSKKKHSSKRHISNSQKEERKKKLKEIACKGKEDLNNKSKTDDSSSSKTVSNVKVTNSNRGAFLSDVIQVVKPMERKESPTKPESEKQHYKDTKKNERLNHESETKKESKKQSSKTEKKDISQGSENIENKKSEKKKHKHSSRDKLHDSSAIRTLNTSIKSRVPLKSLKPLTDSEESFAGKPFSKVGPFSPKKTKKTVRFSEKEPEILYFEIQEGNRMKKTSLVRSSLAEVAQMPIFSLEKITLMKILRWNPHWLEEQVNNNEPPPILGHSNPPLAVFHSFGNHNQYVQLIGDLLLMEIWECLSIAYMKIRSELKGIQMRIASLPPVPTQERHFDLFNLSVDVSVPTADVRSMPRVGEILLVTFGPENARHQRFFFVHNIRCLPSPPSNKNSFYNISLHATFTDKMKLLKPGEVMIGVSLAYINKELSLFEAMAYMVGSPLSEAILRPEPRHFVRNNNIGINMKSQWTMTLNPSQQAAVKSSVSAALGDQPSIQMVQGPPGTGKSSVICAIVMTYFYDAMGRKQQNRGKILICATSNAAVDELIIRLLNIRQSLPKMERFRMVRVGRAEAMHPRALDVSSQQLAQRDAVRLQQEPVMAVLDDEIVHLEAKKNMWKSAALDAAAKDPMRVAYCEGRVAEVEKRISLLRAGGGSGGGADEIRPERLLGAERRIIEGADIIVTTLASAHNHKMRGLKRRIALCIVDEAGQAIEPETLIPLTLDVTNLTLIGDPQQLPGYICSQRAKKHGLGDSLFSRLASCAEMWEGDKPLVLLQQQYRMQAEIADYPNRAFYGGQVVTMTPQRPELPFPPYCILGISSGDKGQNAAGANEMEAWGVCRLVMALIPILRANRLGLAVITPYNAHKELVKRCLRRLQQPNEPPVEVNTVDSFQGQERDVVLVSLARSHGVGFLTDAGRMNVMLTRARHALLVCLNPHAVLKNHQWRTLVEDAQNRNVYKALPFKMCQSTSSIPNEEVINIISKGFS